MNLPAETGSIPVRHTPLPEETVATLSAWVEVALTELEERQKGFITQRSLAGSLMRGRSGHGPKNSPRKGDA